MVKITPAQAIAALNALKDAVANPTQFSNDIFTEVELIEFDRFNSGFIQPPSRSGRTLVRSGRLRDSVSGRFPDSIREIASGQMLRFGTRVPYAALHEFGGTQVTSQLQAFGRPTNPYTKISYYPRRHFLGDFTPEEVARINRRIAENIGDRVRIAMMGPTIQPGSGFKE
jgi:phage gpG-like protein